MACPIESERARRFGNPVGLYPVTKDFLPILAVDTATEYCSVALLTCAGLTERIEAAGQRHSELLLPMVDAVLGQSGVALADVAVFAFGSGPGSFTGLRIACAVVQGLAWGVGRPVVAVGNLLALAQAASVLQPAARRIAVAIDARMHEVYWAVYDVHGGMLQELVAPSLTAAASLPAALEPFRPDLIAGNALRVYAAELQSLSGSGQWPWLAPSAATMVRLAHQLAQQGMATAPHAAAPLYVRNQVALTIEQRAARRAAAAVA